MVLFVSKLCLILSTFLDVASSQPILVEFILPVFGLRVVSWVTYADESVT